MYEREKKKMTRKINTGIEKGKVEVTSTITINGYSVDMRVEVITTTIVTTTTTDYYHRVG